MTMLGRLHLLFVVCFLLGSLTKMYGQGASFEESVEGTNSINSGCSEASTTKLAILCTNSWLGPTASGYEEGIAENGFGNMSVYGYSSITISQQGSSAIDDGIAEAIIEDTLSVVGLQNQETAFLKLEAQCVECATIANATLAFYVFQARTTGYYNFCEIPTAPANSPLCRDTIPIVYSINTEQPDTIFIERNLMASAITNVINGAAGATVTTTVCIGYKLCTAPATVKASVVNAQGGVIQGVTVVGASGHIYN